MPPTNISSRSRLSRASSRPVAHPASDTPGAPLPLSQWRLPLSLLFIPMDSPWPGRVVSWSRWDAPCHVGLGHQHEPTGSLPLHTGQRKLPAPCWNRPLRTRADFGHRGAKYQEVAVRCRPASAQKYQDLLALPLLPSHPSSPFHHAQTSRPAMDPLPMTAPEENTCFVAST